MRVMITGSFDPVTVGHEDVIRRASLLFESVSVTVFVNREKTGFFTVEERAAFLSAVAAKYPNVTVDLSYGYVVDYAREKGVSLLVRSLRGESDLAYEMKMAEYNRQNGDIDTVFLPGDPALSEVSSSEVRRRIACGEPYDPLLPVEIREEVEKIVKNRSLNPKTD